MDIKYVESESMPVQGKEDEIYKRYGKEWNIREQGNGNGNWLLSKKVIYLSMGKAIVSLYLNIMENSD